MSDTPSWLHLTEEEEVMWQGHPVLWMYLSALVAGVALIVIGAALPLLESPVTELIDQTIGLTFAGIILAALGVGTLAYGLLRYRTTDYAVTSQEVYHKRGVIARNVDQIRFERVQNTSCHQSVIERLLSFGDVNLDTAGGDTLELSLHAVRNPQHVNRIIQEQITETHSASESAETADSTESTTAGQESAV